MYVLRAIHAMEYYCLPIHLLTVGLLPPLSIVNHAAMIMDVQEANLPLNQWSILPL